MAVKYHLLRKSLVRVALEDGRRLLKFFDSVVDGGESRAPLAPKPIIY
jgi:hypothetical protein